MLDLDRLRCLCSPCFGSTTLRHIEELDIEGSCQRQHGRQCRIATFTRALRHRGQSCCCPGVYDLTRPESLALGEDGPVAIRPRLLNAHISIEAGASKLSCMIM